ncbi:MAG TPA: hypothetical protein VKT70_07775 [Stellaceae bacterium]|nr:hypothetical protein [Stellaceae bacterium]
MRLNPIFRLFFYLTFAVLIASGVAWFLFEPFPLMLALHGGSAMLFLLALGSMLPLHLLPAWGSGKNLATGLFMGAAMLILIVSAHGLYYLGSETLRGWASEIHLWVGLAVPILLVVHILIGRAWLGGRG